MKIFASVFIVLILCACGPAPEPTPPPTKKVIDKITAVEQRMGVDFFADEPLRQKTTTIYYILAEDGTVAEVGLSTYTRTKVGDTFSTYNWREQP